MEQDLESDLWRFTFCGEAMFVTTFAPCYGTDHARYGFGSKSTFIYLQPNYSFEHHNVPANSQSAVSDIAFATSLQRGKVYSGRGLLGGETVRAAKS
jgi:hypothetical protein